MPDEKIDTLDKFFAQLPREGWSMTRSGMIYFGDQYRSPLDMAAHETRNTAGVWQYEVARMIGLDDTLATAIIHATVNSPVASKALRKRLVEHCGLKEVA